MFFLYMKYNREGDMDTKEDAQIFSMEVGGSIKAPIRCVSCSLE